MKGIVLAQLNTLTGKPLNSTRYNIVTSNEAEAAHLEYNNGYYYIFYNQRICCAGLESSYTIYMGRSNNITGPYYDMNGVSLNQGGGSVFLGTNGRYVGPGHFGFGEGKLTYHFYDGNDYGVPKLKVSSLTWSNGWPYAAIQNSEGGIVLPGTYKIINKNSNKILDAANCSFTDGTNVQQWNDLNNVCQSWTIKPAYDGFYFIENRNSGDVLDAESCSFESGTNVDLWPNLGNWCQQWSFVDKGNGAYRIVNRSNGKDMEVVNASTGDGANVQLWAMNNHNCQQWLLSEVGDYITDGTYTLTNRNSGKVLDVTNCSSSDGANIQQWANLNNACQQWKITRKSNGYYKLQNVNSSKMLDVVNCGTDEATNVDQWTDFDNICQEWYFVYVGDGYYRIVNNNNLKNLEVAYASVDNGANVQMYSNNGNTCQQWALTRLKSGEINEKKDGQLDETSDILIYPNPANDILYISSIIDNTPYVILKIDGVEIMNGIITNNNINIDYLESGVYIISIIKTNGYRIIRQFIKK
ncbi:MAG: RICIN domain-containing protein [Marinilabiliaceae bacterium]|nr:RICIN domain-containing protein [Marinilabiliaceae bacterium]